MELEYEKQNFTDGQVLSAEHLNHIEDGIVAVVTEINNSIGGIGTALDNINGEVV